MANTDVPTERINGIDAEEVSHRRPQDALATVLGVELGAPPSNTAPANSINPPPGTHILRSGMDSLYVSYPGKLSRAKAEEFESLKDLAKLPTPAERAGAIIESNNHQFEVRDRGKGRFPYVFADNWYHIQVSGENSLQLPLAYVQIRSELLTRGGWEASLADLDATLKVLLDCRDESSISRVDICTDFTTDVDIDAFSLDAWIARPKQKCRYYSAEQFTGYAFGLGGDMSARLYDKTEELKKSRKLYLERLWRESGWDGVSPVWRLEFQFKRAVLRELGVETPEDLALHIADLWRYATQDWLRLVIPNPNDATRARWANHPLWNGLGNVPWDWALGEPLSRIQKERVPNDHYLFKNGISGITSYMARNGIYDFYDGLSGFIRDAVDYHWLMGMDAGETLQSYALAKTLDKARRYNTLINPGPKPEGSTEVGE